MTVRWTWHNGEIDVVWAELPESYSGASLADFRAVAEAAAEAMRAAGIEPPPWFCWRPLPLHLRDGGRTLLLAG